MTLLSWQLGYTTLLSGLYSIFLWWWGSCASVLFLERKYGKSDKYYSWNKFVLTTEALDARGTIQA